MPEFDAVRSVGELSAAGDVNALRDAFARIIKQLGMTCSASGMVSGARALSANPFHFTDWPAVWLEVYLAKNYAAIDPLPRWAIVSGEAVSWSEIKARLPASAEALEVMRGAARYGFHEGFATPVRTSAGALGLVTVGGGKRPAFSLPEKLYLQTVSTSALLRAEALLGDEPIVREQFTLRERECIALLRQGFTDAEIGKVLRIAVTTVRSHLENARRKAGARNRVDLAAR